MDDAPPPVGWPFLVARGRTVGFRVVLAPPFLVNGRLTGLLMEASATDATLGDALARREVLNSRAGDFIAFFHSVQADRAIVDERAQRPDEALLDEGSRPIILTEGVIFREPARTTIDATTLELMHNMVKDAYREFWLADDPTMPTRASAPIPLSHGQKVTVPALDLQPLGLSSQPEEPAPGIAEPPVPTEITTPQDHPRAAHPSGPPVTPTIVFLTAVVLLLLAVIIVAM
ncbi:hypothetical protein [Spirillospora sp. NPDC047279]|uniref:hypothetical protein n=1 Tax=Spirillospora sp. NPDC047279 TaxID=3155478 RepID=UPI0033F1B7FF